MRKFKVEVVNEILGNSVHEMTLNQIKEFNLVALFLAKESEKTNKTEASGMWRVTAT